MNSPTIVVPREAAGGLANSVARGAADWVCLATAPTFAINGGAGRMIAE
jgi:hypothetical protein